MHTFVFLQTPDMSNYTMKTMDMGEMVANRTARIVIGNETYCWEENIENYTWCKMPIYSVPFSKYASDTSGVLK